jgi:glycosyltransferase involved in cell wall biosynthesis
VIDSLPSLGGGEKVLLTALELYPHAELFTLVYNRGPFFHTPIAQRKVHTSFLDSLPLAHRQHRFFLPLMPFAIERFDLMDYDRIVCFSYAVAHGVKKYASARHLAYMFTPMRYAWTDLNLNGTHTRKNFLLDAVMRAFRSWDRKAAARVDEFATISCEVASRISSAYQRTAPVIHPPVEVERFSPNEERGNFYVTVSRLVPHKRVDLVVQAFAQLKLPLVIVGDGPELPRLQSLAASNIRFVGYASDHEVAQLLGRARGFVSMAEEDFGIAIVEAQAAGCPVIAYGKGGALETVIDGVTGVFFREQSVPSLIDAIVGFENRLGKFQTHDMLQNARKYAKRQFMQKFRKFVDRSG